MIFPNSDCVRLGSELAQARQQIEELKRERANGFAGLLIHERLLLAISRSGGPAKCWADEFNASWVIRGKLPSNLKQFEQQLAEARAQAFKEAAAIARKYGTLEGHAIATRIERVAEALEGANKVSKIFKAEAEGDTMYIAAANVEEAKRKLQKICGPIPDSTVTWSEVPKLPKGEALMAEPFA